MWAFPLFNVAGNTVTVGQLTVAILVAVIGFLLIRMVNRNLSRRIQQSGMSADHSAIMLRAFSYLCALGVLFGVLSLLNVPLSAFAFLSGAIAIGLGFGAQNIINNFISGWILMTEKPVRVGDLIEIENMHGTVERIGNRCTRIRRLDGARIMVPNSMLLDKMVINWTLIDQNMNGKVTVGVAYGADVNLVKQLLEDILKNQTFVLDNPAPIVLFSDFGDSTLLFDALFWLRAASMRELNVARSTIRFAISDTFAKHGIEIAFPQRDLHIKPESVIRVEMGESQ